MNFKMFQLAYKEQIQSESIDLRDIISKFSPGHVFMINQDGAVISQNALSKNISNTDNFFNLIDKQSIKNFQDDLVLCKHNIQQTSGQFRTPRQKDNELYFAYFITHFKDDLFIVTLIDQTSINEEIIKLNNIINTVPDPILVKNEEHRLLYVNQAYAESIGLEVRDIVGKFDIDFHPADEVKTYRKQDRKAFKVGSSTNEEPYTDLKLGKRIISTKKAVYKTANGNKILVGIIRDITEIKQAREILHKQATELQKQVINRTEQLQIKTVELEYAVDQLRNLNSDLDCFAHICCHELRSPLRTLTNFSKLVLEELDRGETKNIGEYLITIHDRALKMDQLMKSILEYSTSGLNKNAYSTFSIEELLNEITLMLNVQIHEKKAVIIYQNMPTIYADRMQFFQLFQNLINNAIKFSKPSIAPAVTITAKKTPNTITFQVKDNGLGIAKKYHKELFLPFKKFHTRAEGSQYGIGLSLCKKIVENHGGTIKISSSENAGTTFTFITPINKIVLNNDKI